jgi:phosphoglycolate phosphatase
MHRPAALLFDLDGTLVDSAVTIALALTQLSAARGGGTVDVARVRRLVSQGAPVLVRETLGAFSGGSEEDVAAFRAILAGIPADPATIFPGVVDALTALAGHPCGVVTNKPEGLTRLLLDQLGLTRFFQVVVGGDTLPVCKPDPAPLLHALAGLGGEGGTGGAIMIGDSAVDAVAAVAAGTGFMMFEGGYGPVDKNMPDVHRRFGSFADLPSLVGDMLEMRAGPRT